MSGAAGDIGASRSGGEVAAPDALGREGFAVVAMLLLAIAGGHGAPESSPEGYLRRGLWLLFYAAAAARLIQARRTDWVTLTIRHQPAGCVLLALALASCLWSLDPWTSAAKATSMVGTTVLGLYLGIALSPRRWMRVLQWTFTLFILSSVAVEWLCPPPAAAVVNMKLGWRGITGHPNTFGGVAALAAVFFLAPTLTRRARSLWGPAMAALSVFALVASRSRTSIAAFAFLLATSIALVLARDAGLDFSRAWRRTSLALVLAVGLLPFLLAPLAPAFGDRDPLNGRLRIWSGALAILRERPWTGYGYAVVWGRAKATLLPHIPITAHPSSTDAHNSIVDVATTLGIPAAAVACVYLFGALSDAGRLFARESNAFSFFALAFVVGSVAMGFGESHLLHVHWFFWILFVGVTATVKRTLERPPADSVLDRAPVS